LFNILFQCRPKIISTLFLGKGRHSGYKRRGSSEDFKMAAISRRLGNRG